MGINSLLETQEEHLLQRSGISWIQVSTESGTGEGGEGVVWKSIGEFTFLKGKIKEQQHHVSFEKPEELPRDLYLFPFRLLVL